MNVRNEPCTPAHRGDLFFLRDFNTRLRHDDGESLPFLSELEMKNIVAISCLAFLVACGGGNDDNVTPAGGDSDQTTGQDNSTGTPAAAMEGSAFLGSSYQVGSAEMELARLALLRASNEDVRNFAQRMIEHHTQSNNDIAQLAQGKGITLASGTTTAQQDLYNSMASLSGTAFDLAYMVHSVAQHDLLVGQFGIQATGGNDAEINALAMSKLPVLQAHLYTAKGIDGAINSTSFLMHAYLNGQEEIALSTIALQRSSNTEVRAYAQRMIDDHTATSNEIVQLAQTRNVILPSFPTGAQRMIRENISTMTGTDFDKAYMNHNVLAHEVAVAQARAQAQNNTDTGIQQFAARALPALTLHLELATVLYDAITPSLPFMAFQDGMGEIMLSKLALQKSADPEVQQFAQRMITDHTVMNAQVLPLAQGKSLTLPREISPEQLLAYITQSKLTGTAFDQAYMRRNVDVHARDVDQFRAAAATDLDADFRAFANAGLPTLTAHLQQAQQISSRLGSGT
jgi:predicted outer membrane protein